jgi:hypothetical protein
MVAQAVVNPTNYHTITTRVLLRLAIFLLETLLLAVFI